VAAIVRARFPPATDRFCAACHRLTAGNPFLVGELLSAAAAAAVEPTDDGASGLDGFTPERVRDLFELVEDPVSLETPVGDGESMVADLIEDEKSESPDGATAEHARSADLAAAIDRLNPRMRHVVLRRFGLDGEPPQTLEELGVELGITRERVRQIETRALRELRLAAPGLRHYLQ
jgi:RNA polymerase primary sigma factor